MTTLRAHFDGRVLVPEGEVNLPVGRPLEIDVREPSEHRRGSAALILQLMAQPPHLTAEHATDLQHAIEEGRRPARNEGIFDAPDSQHD